MNKFYICILLLFCSVNILHGQNIDKTILNQINLRAKTFCDYVVAVGTTPGQPGAASESEKNDIIKNRVPGLFYNYKEAPRMMITTSGKNGGKQNKKKMSDYFVNLKMQSKSALNKTRIYTVKFMGVVSGSKRENGKEYKTLSDGSLLYIYKARFEQTLVVMTHTKEGRVLVNYEKDYKDLEVYEIVTPKGKHKVLLGDIVRARRI